MSAGFHPGGGHFGFPHGRPMKHADMQRDMHGGRMHRGEGNHRGGRGWSDHVARTDFGHWRRQSGFGSDTHSPLIADGQWHAGGEFR